MVPQFGPWAKDVVARALESAGLGHGDVSFWGCHQPTAWFNAMCREAAGLTSARASDTFPKVGGVSASNVAFNLDEGIRTRKLKAGEVAVLYAMGSGASWGSIVMRWGK
jgi:3-oxoacyl-[acyl-carrier-protein] synthase-3